MTNYFRESATSNSICKLVDITTIYSTNKKPTDFTKLNGLKFLINPVELSRGIQVSGDRSNGINTSIGHYQYGYTDRLPVVLNGCIVDSRCSTIDLQKYVDEFEKLCFKGANTQPPILALVFGQRVIQPIILDSINITETGWSNGYMSRGTFDLSFSYIQPPEILSKSINVKAGSTPREKAKTQQPDMRRVPGSPEQPRRTGRGSSILLQ